MSMIGLALQIDRPTARFGTTVTCHQRLLTWPQASIASNALRVQLAPATEDRQSGGSGKMVAVRRQTVDGFAESRGPIGNHRNQDTEPTCLPDRVVVASRGGRNRGLRKE